MVSRNLIFRTAISANWEDRWKAKYAGCLSGQGVLIAVKQYRPDIFPISDTRLCPADAGHSHSSPHYALHNCVYKRWQKSSNTEESLVSLSLDFQSEALQPHKSLLRHFSRFSESLLVSFSSLCTAFRQLLNVKSALKPWIAVRTKKMVHCLFFVRVLSDLFIVLRRRTRQPVNKPHHCCRSDSELHRMFAIWAVQDSIWILKWHSLVIISPFFLVLPSGLANPPASSVNSSAFLSSVQLIWD